MEYVEGPTLREVIARDGRLDPRRAALIVAHLAQGLQAAHRIGLIHRDVKPSNIVILAQNNEDFAKLLDFGIVRFAEDRTKLTQPGLMIGTPAYMAPEQSTSSNVTFAADLYSLGVVPFEMLAGQRPFSGQSVPSLLMMHAKQPPPRLPPSGGLEALAKRLLAKHPGDRPSSAAEVAEEANQIETRLRNKRTSGETKTGPAQGEAMLDPTLETPSVELASEPPPVNSRRNSVPGSEEPPPRRATPMASTRRPSSGPTLSRQDQPGHKRASGGRRGLVCAGFGPHRLRRGAITTEHTASRPPGTGSRGPPGHGTSPGASRTGSRARRPRGPRGWRTPSQALARLQSGPKIGSGAARAASAG